MEGDKSNPASGYLSMIPECTRGPVDEKNIKSLIDDAIKGCFSSDSRENYQKVYALLNRARFMLPQEAINEYVRRLVTITHAKYLFARKKDRETLLICEDNFLTALRRAEYVGLDDIVERYREDKEEILGSRDFEDDDNPFHKKARPEEV